MIVSNDSGVQHHNAISGAYLTDKPHLLFLATDCEQTMTTTAELILLPTRPTDGTNCALALSVGSNI